MIAVHETVSVFWNRFWEALEEAECPWAKQLHPNAQADFAQTIESMLLASIPAEPMSRLSDVWSSLHLEDSLSECKVDSPDLPWWNLMLTLDGPDEITDEEANEVLQELWGSQDNETKSNSPVSQDAMNVAPELLRWLKYTALCTVWQFSLSWSCFTASVPREVTDHLRKELFSLAMLVLLRQLR